MYQKRNHNNKGFTLTEVLIVVAITIILLAVSFVAAAYYRKYLKITELDNAAREIFMSAQNRAVLLKNRDSLSDLVVDEDGSNLIENVDMGDGDDGSIQVDVYYVDSGYPDIDELLPEGAVDPALRAGAFYIVYEVESASVADVFYWEEAWSGDFTEFYRTYRQASRSVRMKLDPMAGYYGGDAAESGSSIALRTPVINIYNEDELKAEITWWIPRSLLSEADRIKMKVTLKYEGKEIELSDGAHEDRLTDETSSDGSAYRTLTAAYLLDSLYDENMRFRELFKDASDLVMGGDFTITAEVYYDEEEGTGGTKKKVNGASKTAEDNSLFAKGYGDATSGGDTAYIEYTRHLQNLREDFSQNTGNKQKQTQAVQIADISCPEGYSFLPILSNALQGYDGQTYEIRDLDVKRADSISLGAGGSVYSAGLFSAVKGTAADSPFVLRDVWLVNASVGDDSADYAGALAGAAEYAFISGCRSYWENDSSDHIGLGYLLTDDAGNIIYKIKGKNAGGLFGSLSDSTVEGSLAASTVEGASTAGGLAAAGSNVSFKGSYADCYLSGNKAAGLVGSLSGNAVIDTCYTAGFISGGDNKAGAGLCLGDGSAKVKNTYTAMSYQNLETNGKNYPLCQGEGSKYEEGSVFYLYSSYVTTLETYEAEYQELTDPQWCKEHFTSGFESRVAADSHPYNLLKELSLLRYPYPGISSVDHYGDWAAEFKDGSLVYYEEYEENGASSYGFEGANLSNLSEKAPVKDGYAIAFDQKKDAEGEIVQLGVEILYVYEDENGNEVEKTAKYILGADGSDGVLPLLKAEKNGNTYYLAPLPDDLINSEYAPENFYRKISYTIGTNPESETYYYNPHFACTAMEYDESLNLEEAAEKLQVRVRTPRHLNELSRHKEYYAGYHNYVFLEELDLDFAYYTGYGLAETIKEGGQNPIGINASAPFRNTYNGGCHVISNLPVNAPGNYVGLFGYNAGVIRNVVFLCEVENPTKVTRSSSAAGVFYAGGLVGYNSGSIYNSAAADMTLELHAYNFSTAYVGGLAGYNHGTITSSEAAMKMISVEATYSNAYVGGFVGCNGNGANITGCYGISRIDAVRSRSGTVYAGGFAALNQGAMRGSYCAADLTVSGGAEMFGFCNGSVTNCYYLNQGNFSYDGEIFSAQYEENGKAVSCAWAEMTDGSAASALGFNWDAASYDKTGKLYPYPGVVKDAAGNYVHYGDWPTPVKLGVVGVCYWEKEVTYVDNIPVNTAYHFSAISVDTDKNTVSHIDTLCTEHDDGGVIEEYGYGYFYTGEKPDFEHPLTLMGEDAYNEEASGFLKELMGEDYNFVVYTTARAGDQTDGEIGGNIAYTFLAREKGNGNQIGIVYDTWELKRKDTDGTYSFYVNPFFGDSIAYADEDNDAGTMDVDEDVPTKKPGSSDALPYRVRSVEQLEFINWNLDDKDGAVHRDVNTVLTENNYTMYPYLSYYDGSAVTERKYYWKQSHDLNGRNSGVQTPVAEFLDNTSDNKGYLYGWFSGTYDGADYVIANVNIQGQGSSCTGLFGIVFNGTLKNIVMYSEDGTGTVTSRDYDSGSKWFAMGALAGLAASSSGDSAVENCSVAGYTIYDYHQMNSGGWGGSGIGGLLGISNMKLTNCSAVTDIIIESVDNDNMRIGGLVGACQQSISSCYAGGEIKFNGKIDKMDKSDGSGFAYIGGIVGGIYMKPLVTGIYTIGDGKYLYNSLNNCYSFVILPEANKYVRGLYAVGGAGEIKEVYDKTGVGAPDGQWGLYNEGKTTYENCYYLKETVLSNNNGIYPVNNTADDLNDKENVTPLSYDEMSDGTLLKALKDNGAAFSTVTTRTGDNRNSIDGKYSFATSNILIGLNYPFPTILTQANDTYASKTVNVHYGNWPLSGLQREHGNLPVNIDIFADYEKTEAGEAALPSYAEDKAIARESISLSDILKAKCPDGTLSVSCINVASGEDTEAADGEGTGGTEETEDAVAEAYFLDEDGTTLSESVTLTDGKINNGDPVLIIEGLREGTSTVTVKYEPSTSSVSGDQGFSVTTLEITVNVTAVLQLRPAQETAQEEDQEATEETKTVIEPLESAVCFTGNSVLTELYAFDSQGNPVSDNLKEKLEMTVNPSVTGMDSEYISRASCADVLEEDGTTKVPCRADLSVTAKNESGDTSLIVEFEYTYNGKTYQASSTVNLSIRELSITAEDAALFIDEPEKVNYDSTKIEASLPASDQSMEEIDLSDMVFLNAYQSGDFYAHVDTGNAAQVVLELSGGASPGRGILFLEMSFHYGGGLHTVSAQAAVFIYESRLQVTGDALTDGVICFKIDEDSAVNEDAAVKEYAVVNEDAAVIEETSVNEPASVDEAAADDGNISVTLAAELLGCTDVEYVWELSDDIKAYLTLTYPDAGAYTSAPAGNTVTLTLFNKDGAEEALASGEPVTGSLTVTAAGRLSEDSTDNEITKTAKLSVVITNSDILSAGSTFIEMTSINSEDDTDTPDDTEDSISRPSETDGASDIDDGAADSSPDTDISGTSSGVSDMVVLPDTAAGADEDSFAGAPSAAETVVIPESGDSGSYSFTGSTSARTGGFAYQETDADIWGEG